MPQELHILRCYSCKTYQVHIVKKVKTWKCKICNEKQSVQRVYFQGSGQDCRVNVQKLNALRAEETEEKAEEEMQYDDNDDEAVDQFYQPEINLSNISYGKLGDNSELSGRAEEEMQYNDNDDKTVDQFYQPEINLSNISYRKLDDNSELSGLPKFSNGSLSSSSGQSNLESVENEFLSKSAHISENTPQVVNVQKICSTNSIFECHGEIDLTFDV